MDNCQSQIPPLHGSRFCFQEQFRYYYAYGNTPAQDFLEYASSDLKNEEPSVLVLGCGDIRSCFHTIWKNFDPGFKHRFKGVHFVINDRSAAVLARNIIFLYLCLKTPKSKREREKWLFALWSIWFCHELLQEHTGVLKGALEVLLKFSVSNRQWCKPDNPLHSLVHCFSPATFKEIRDTWSMWYNREVKVGSVESMKAARLAEVENCLRNIKNESTIGTLDLCGSHVGRDMYRDKLETMCNEYQSYLESGSVYGESLFRDIRPQLMTKETSVNLTLYERIDGKYTIHYGSCPFRCFQHTYICSVKEMLNTGMHVAATVNDCVLIDSKAFERTPLLANSFQQFSISVICTANVLQNQQANISFTFNCLDVFEFCHSWEVECSSKQFDLIFATNVIDSVAPPAFIIAAIRLLKDNGYFLSPTMLFRLIAPTAEKYLEAVFGFHPKLLPVLCGIRCINHEDVAYASSVSHNHSPLDSGDVEIAFSSMCEKVLIWERVKMDPLCVESMSLHLDITLALCGSFLTSCTPLLTNPDGIKVLNCLCTNTSIELLKTFLSRLITDLSKSHKHLEQLCSTMREQKLLKTFLASIQIQAMLNGLHLHIMVNESTCPICTDLPLSNYLGLFCVEVEMTHISSYSPMFMVLLHKEPFLSSIQALLEVSQIFDCLSGVTQGSTLKLYFHAPLTFVKDGYKLTVIQYTVCTTPEKCLNFPSIVLQGEFSKYRVDLPSVPPPHWPQPLPEHSSSLGTLIKHFGNGDAFESALSFAEDELPALLSADLRVEQISRAEVKIQCLGRCLEIRYPYPVAYDKLIVQRHKKAKTLIVKAKRTAHCYVDEGQLFHVNPEDHFSLPPIMVSSDKLQQMLLFQFTLKERKFLVPSSKSVAPPLLTVKKWIAFFLTATDANFFPLVLPDQGIVGFVEVINRVIDVKRKVPAIDLRFCFLDTLPETTASFIDGELIRLSYRKSFECRELLLKKEVYYNLLKRVFHSFSLHTLQSTGEHSLSSRFSPVKESRTETYFRRAVVYPLYPDPDVAVHDLSRGKSCSYCNNRFEVQDLMKCSTCMSASYCSIQCQRNHWSDHKIQCKSTKSKDKASGSIQGSYSHNPQLSAVVQQEQSLESTAEDKKTPAFSEQDMLGQNRYEELPNAHKQAKASETSGQSSLSSCALNNDVRCSYCKLHIEIQNLKKCMGCKSTSYCSKQCQRNHWSEHKLQCKSTKREDKSPGSIQGSSSPNFEPPVAIQQEQPPLSTELKSPGNIQGSSFPNFEPPVAIQKEQPPLSTEIKSPGNIQGSSSPNFEPPVAIQQEQPPLSTEITEEDSRSKSPASGKQDMHVLSSCELNNDVRCSYCKLHIEIQNLKKCMGCKSTSYCSKQCQRNHWSEHKLQCKSTKREDKSPGNIQGSSSPNFELPVAIQQEQPPLSTEIRSPGNIQGSSSPNFEPPVAIQQEQPPLSTEITEEDSRSKSPASGKQDMKDLSSCELNNDVRCSYCKLHIEIQDLKKCMGCKSTSYCSKQCQRNHWSEHKLQCKRTQSKDKAPGSIQGSYTHNPQLSAMVQQEQSLESTAEDKKSPAFSEQDMLGQNRYEEFPNAHKQAKASETSGQSSLSSCEVRCSYCKLHIEIQNLKKCMGCKSTSYCSKQCQRNHWSEHKLQCKSTKREDKSPGNIQGSSSPNFEPPVAIQREQPPLSTEIKSPGNIQGSSSPNFEPPVAIQREQPPLSTEVKSPGNIQGSSSPNFEPPVAIQQEQPPLSTENTEEDSRSKSPASGKQDMQNLSSCELNNDVRCTNCKLHIEIQNLMKCSTCMSASYCSKKCQRNHWSEHKLQCKSTKREDKSPRNTQGSFACNTQPSLQQKQSPRPTVKEDSELKPSSSDKQETRGQISEKEFPAAPKEAKPSQQSGSHLKTLRNERCGYCQKRTPSLKSCLGCHKVSYCGRDCQRAHWKQHKDYCKSLK